MSDSNIVASCPEGATVLIRLRPKAGRFAVCGILDGALEIAVPAPPVDGQANAACRRYLSKLLGVPQSRVLLRTGERSRHKLFLIQGVRADEAQKRLEENME
ncbi:MAG: DUF167 domain-containing protein [Candidatus Schekmanbacteria bacterium]|nr:DUF167 domain-containing protein [Candidatus Schekmanbacteria bacterium]